MWDAFKWRSGAQMQYLKNFAFSIGKRYQELEPLTDLVTPNKSYDILSYEGWAYCARTPDKNIFLVYFERGCPQAQLRGAHLNGVYGAQWFNPRNGTWINVDEEKLHSSNVGIIRLPDLPDGEDWGLKLIYEGKWNDTYDNKVQEQREARNKVAQRKKRNMMILCIAVIGFVVSLDLFLMYRLRRFKASLPGKKTSLYK
jgi:hypothetical protein